MGSSASKGRRGEQEVARILYKAWFGVEPSKEREFFVRVGFGRKQPYGDLIVPPDFPFIVEVKNINFDLQQITPATLQSIIKNKANLPVAVFLKLNHKWWVVVVEKGTPPDGFWHIHTPNWSATLYPLKVFVSILADVKQRGALKSDAAQ